MTVSLPPELRIPSGAPTREPLSPQIEPLEKRIAPALLLAVSDGSGTSTPGGTITYTLDYSNTGPGTAAGVVVSDTLPAGTTFDPAENVGWTNVGGNLSFAAGDLALGAAGQATLTLHVAAVAPAGLESIVNTATIQRALAVEPEAIATDTNALVAAPDLVVTKTANAPGVTPGGTVSYSFAFTNAGNQDATGVLITDTLPTHTSFDALSNPGWVLNGTTLTFDAGSVAAGSLRGTALVLGVDATVPAGLNNISNTATIADDGTNGTDPTPANNESTAVVVLNAAPDLTLLKTDNVAQVQRGQMLSYTLSYANVGNQDATGLVITDTLPTGMLFDGALNPGWVRVGNTLTFAVGALAVGGHGLAALVLQVDPNASALLTAVSNTATIADDGANGVDPTPANNRATDVDALIAPVDLTLTKSDGVTVVVPGETLIYTFDYSNAGGIDATGVVITDTLPEGTSFDPGANPGWTLNGSALSFSVGSVAIGASGSATLVLTVASAAPAGLFQIVNNASIVDDGMNGGEANAGNNSATDTDQIDATTDLALTKTATAPVVLPGGGASFNFAFTNKGNRDAAGVTLTDTLPAGTTFDGAANPGWVLDGSTLTFDVGSLAAGAQGSATLVLGVDATVPAGKEELSNTASIADNGNGGIDPTPEDNTSTASILLDAAPDFTLTKTDGVTTAIHNQTLTYSFTYANAGTQAASGVKLTDTLPDGTVFDGATNPGWVLNGSTLTFDIGSLAAGAQGAATLVLTVASLPPAQLEAITNVATISDDGASGADLNPANNTAIDVDTLTHLVDLTLVKGSASTSVAPGGSVTFTFTFANTGDTSATGVVLTDTLPAGTTFDGAANPGWVLNGSTLTFDAGSVAGGTGGSATLILGIAAAAPAGLEQIANTASIADDGTHGADFTPADNTSSVTLTLNATPDLTLTKSGGNTTVVPGGTLTYSLAYANAGNQNATGVTLTDTLPANTTFDPNLNPGWTLNGSTLSFTVGSVDAGAQGSVPLVLKVTPTVPAGATQIVNSGSIADDGVGGVDPTPADNASTATNPLDAHFDLVLGLTAGAASVTPGGAATFTLAYSNAGNQGALGVVLTENLPVGTSFNAAGSTEGWVQQSPGVFTLAVGSLDAGASGSAVFAVTATSPAAAGQEQLTDSALIAGTGTDFAPADNSKTTTVALTAAPDLGVSMVASKTKLTAGGTVIYSITYTNTGNQNASGVMLTDILPQGMSFISAGSSSGWVLLGPKTFGFNIGSLNVGQSVTVDFKAKVSSALPAGAHQNNRITIADNGTSGPDSNPANNAANLSLVVRSAAAAGGITARADDGVVKVYDARTLSLLYKFRPYEEGVSHVSVALGDINGDGIFDIVASSKETSKVKVFDGRTGARINSFKPFGNTSEGVDVIVADIDHDHFADILAKDRSDGSKRVFSGASVRIGIDPIKILSY